MNGRLRPTSTMSSRRSTVTVTDGPSGTSSTLVTASACGVWLCGRALDPAMTGARFDHVQLNRRDLRQPFPAGFARRIQGQTVRALTRRGKYLLGELSSGETLVMHLGMSGWFRVEKTRPSTTRRRD